MKFRHLEIFRELMRTQSVTRTAEQLNTSQPTASRFLAELEREVGFRLFLRTRGKLVPTPEALALNREVEHSFEGIERIRTAAANIANFRGERLRVASISSFALGFLAPAIQGFGMRYDALEIAVSLLSFQEVVSHVAAGLCEVGFVAYPVDRPGVVEQVLVPVDAVCVIPKGHPLEEKRVITPADLKDVPFISLGRDIPSGQRIDRIFERAGIRRKIRAETQNAAMACALVDVGVGIAILDPFTAFAMRNMRLAIRRFEPAALFEFRAIRPDRPIARMTQRFIAEIIDQLADLPGDYFQAGGNLEPPISFHR